MTYQLIRGDALSLPLADDSVDLCSGPAGGGRRSSTLRLELGAVLPEVSGTRLKLKIGQRVVQSVAVLVVNHHAGGNGAVRFLPHNYSPRTPHVRLSDLDPRAAISVTFPPGSDGHASDGEGRRAVATFTGSAVRVGPLPRVITGSGAELASGLSRVELRGALGACVRWHGGYSTVASCGTGTVPAVAHALGRHGIGIDLSADYLRLADWRCNDPVLRAKVLRVERPKAVPDGQLDIFGGEAA